MNGFFLKLLMGILFMSFVTQIKCQEKEQSKADSIKFIPISKIPDYQIDAENKLFKINTFLSETSNIDEWTEMIELLEKEIESKEKILDSIDITTLTTDQLQKWDREWDDIEKQINVVFQPLDKRVNEFVKGYEELDNLYQLWLETSINIRHSDIPIDIKNRVAKTKRELKNLRNKLKEEEGNYLPLKYDCNNLLNQVSADTKSIAETRKNIVKNLLIPEQSFLWPAYAESKLDTLSALEHNRLTDAYHNVQSFTKDNPSFLYVVPFVFFIFLSLIVFIQKMFKNNIVFDQIPKTSSSRFILRRPILIGMLLTWIVVPLFYYQNGEVKSILMLLMLFPVLILLKELFGLKKVLMLVIFAVFYMLKATEFLFNNQSFSVRIGYLSVAFLSVGILWYMLHWKRFLVSVKKWIWFARVVLYVLLIMVIISGVFIILGNVLMGIMLLLGFIGILISGILFFASFELLHTLFQIMLVNPLFHKSRIVKYYSSHLLKQINMILGLVLLVSWINVSLNNFAIKKEVLVILKNIITRQFTIGSATFGLNNIVIFVSAVYISILISRIIMFVLEEEVFVRRATDKGASSTIVLLMRYSIISIGFIFAMAAGGIKLGNISIIIGAIGVGIGFGLQNIFNNLISGLILAFERPIKVNDIIQVGELTGIVKDIGFRASRVRTYDGADVIVPNGDIVSNQMINWTLSDKKRRLKINLGVSYNSDPDEVLAILMEIATNHSEVMKEPVPIPRFIGFGESSIDFQLLFWISDFEKGYSIETDITLKLFKKLREKGIEIPYPKRDITITRETDKK